MLVRSPILRMETRSLRLQRLRMILHHVLRGIVLRLVLMTAELCHVVTDTRRSRVTLEAKLNAARRIRADCIQATVVGATTSSKGTAADARSHVHCQLIRCVARESSVLRNCCGVVALHVVGGEGSHLLVVVTGEGTQGSETLTKLVATNLRNEAASVSLAVALAEGLVIELLSSIAADLGVGIDTRVRRHTELINRSIDKW